MSPDQIGQIAAIVTGGAGATVLLGVIAKILWADHQENDDEMRATLRRQGEIIGRLTNAVEKLSRAPKSRP